MGRPSVFEADLCDSISLSEQLGNLLWRRSGFDLGPVADIGRGEANAGELNASFNIDTLDGDSQARPFAVDIIAAQVAMASIRNSPPFTADPPPTGLAGTCKLWAYPWVDTVTVIRAGASDNCGDLHWMLRWGLK